jgi:hypothetical protein
VHVHGPAGRKSALVRQVCALAHRAGQLPAPVHVSLARAAGRAAILRRTARALSCRGDEWMTASLSVLLADRPCVLVWDDVDDDSAGPAVALAAVHAAEIPPSRMILVSRRSPDATGAHTAAATRSQPRVRRASEHRWLCPTG